MYKLYTLFKYLNINIFAIKCMEFDVRKFVLFQKSPNMPWYIGNTYIFIFTVDNRNFSMILTGTCGQIQLLGSVNVN